MTAEALRVVLATLAGAGAAVAWFRSPAAARRHVQVPWHRLLERAGVGEVRAVDLAVSTATSGAAGLIVGHLVFRSPLPTMLVASLVATLPAGVHRQRAARRREELRECWPALIEETRVLVGSAGRSVPQALFEAGSRTPPDLANRFAVAHREWLVTADLEVAAAGLRASLRDPFADALLDTLVIAHEVGGSRLDEQLRRLAEDRTTDLDHRRSARAEQAGVRFARRFVLVVPLGMAAAGLSIGGGASTYEDPAAQAAAAVAIGLVAVCWLWAGAHLRLPEPARVAGR